MIAMPGLPADARRGHLVIKIGAGHVILDENLYMKRAFAMAEAMKTLGFIRQIPATPKLEAYFDYRFLTKATGKSPDELGRNM
jgi:hypothetical protein